MIQHSLFEYLVNSVWQVPLVFLATWLFVRVARPALLVQHSLWVAALLFAVLIPLRGIDTHPPTTLNASAPIQYPAIGPHPIPLHRYPIIPSTHKHKLLAPQVHFLLSIHIRPMSLPAKTIDWLVALYGVLSPSALRAWFVPGMQRAVWSIQPRSLR